MCPKGAGAFFDDGRVYYTFDACGDSGSAGTVLYRADVASVGATSPASAVAGPPLDGVAGDVVVEGNDAYVARSSGAIAHFNAKTLLLGVPPVLGGLPDGGLAGPAYAIAVDGDTLLARQADKLVGIPRDGTATWSRPLSAPATVASTARSQLAVDRAYAYVSGQAGLVRTSRGATEVQTLFGASPVVGVADDATDVYFSVPAERAIYRLTKRL